MKTPLSKKQTMMMLAALLAVVGTVWGAMVWSSTERLELSGLVQAREVKNGSRFGGRVAEIMVAEGDSVAAGQPLEASQVRELRDLFERRNQQIRYLWESERELREHLRHLTPEKAKRIGAAARERMLAEHTYRHRAAEVEAALEGASATVGVRNNAVHS